MSLPAERALAIILIARLKADGWEVFEEVRYRYDPDGTAFWIADVVARKGTTIAVFEVKAAFGLGVMRQAERWINLAHELYVVVPGSGDGLPANTDHAYGYAKLAENGIGVLHIRKHTKLEEQIALRPGGSLPPPEALVVPAQHVVASRCSVDRLEAALHPDQASGEYAGAGTKTGVRVTPANRTKVAIAAVVDSVGGAAPIADVARATGAKAWLITKWAKEQGIKGIALDTSGSEIVLRAVDPGNEQPITATSHKLRPARYIPS